MKNGWGLSTMIIFCSIIGICLIFSIVMFRSHVEKEIEQPEENTYNIIHKTYLGLEEDVALLSKEYFESNDKTIVTINKLIEKGYMDSIYDLKDSSIKCSGYVKKNNKKYQTFLKCGENYQTEGYLNKLDN